MSSNYQNTNFDFYFTKASYGDDGVMRWAATCSDTNIDTYTEKMSLELFQSFIENWAGDGAPKYKVYGSLSHYPSLDGLAEWGEVTNLYVDGDKLKAKGTFYKTKVGEAVFSAIKKDRDEEVPHDKRVRVSIGFYATRYHIGSKTWILGETSEHIEASPGEIKVYDAGMLEHLAVTRIPANRRVDIQIVERSDTSNMSNLAQKQDALSIVPEEIVNEIEQKLGEAPVERNENQLVTKADDNTDPPSLGTVTVINVDETLAGLSVTQLETMLKSIIVKLNDDGTLSEDELSKRVSDALGRMTSRNEVLTVEKTENEPLVEAVPNQSEGAVAEVVEAKVETVEEPIFRGLLDKLTDGLKTSVTLPNETRRQAFQEILNNLTQDLLALDGLLTERSQSGVVENSNVNNDLDNKLSEVISAFDQRFNNLNAQISALTDLVGRMAMNGSAPRSEPQKTGDQPQPTPVQKSLGFGSNGIPFPTQKERPDPNKPRSIRDIVRETVF